LFEDKEATIAQVIKERVTPRVKHLDVLICFMNEQIVFDEITPIYSHTHEMKAGVNTKPHGGETLQKNILNIIGFKYYPKKDSEH